MFSLALSGLPDLSPRNYEFSPTRQLQSISNDHGRFAPAREEKLDSAIMSWICSKSIPGPAATDALAAHIKTGYVIKSYDDFFARAAAHDAELAFFRRSNGCETIGRGQLEQNSVYRVERRGVMERRKHFRGVDDLARERGGWMISPGRVFS